MYSKLFMNSSKKIIRFLSETAIESGTKITLETGAKITTLVNSSEKVKWGEILKDQVLGSFIKDIISGGLSKIFVGRFLDKKVSLKWPSTSALCKEMGIESPVHNKKVTEYFIELINNMGAETLYQTVIKKLLVKSTGKPMTFSEFLDNLSTELIKFVITYPLAKSAKKSR